MERFTMSKHPKPDNKRGQAERVPVDKNEDPLSGEHGAHPIGVGIGAAVTGAAAGAAGGALGGPVGAAVGAVVGAVAGGYGGKAVAEEIDPTVEVEHWRTNYENRPYFKKDVPFDTMAPAYRYGVERRQQHAGKTFDSVEKDLERDWNQVKHDTRLSWQEARNAARDAWCRLDDRCQQNTNQACDPNKR